MRSYRSDVLVVGSGGAGVRAAIAAAELGTVTLVSKGPMGRSGATVIAGADVMADGASLHRLGYGGAPEDSPEAWAEDIVIEGFFLNDENLVAAYVANAGARLEELIRWGLMVRHADNRRAILTTGASIAASLRRGLASVGQRLTLVPHVMVVDLLLRDGQVIGAMGVDYETGELILFKSKAVVLATGGWHQAYGFNAGADELTGDGPAMAYRAGAELVDMEMVTFCPNILLSPPRYRGSLVLYVVPGTLLNSRGDAFLAWGDPRVVKLALTTEWNKLLFSKASMREVLAGRGSPNGGVYFSLKHMPVEIFDSLQEILPNWRFQGDDFSQLFEALREGHAAEVGPAAEYFEGGIRIDERCRTSLAGLYAAGECAGGLFGANRVAAATTEMLVFGEVAGREAARFAAQVGEKEPSPDDVERLADEITAPLCRNGGDPPNTLWHEIRDIAHREVGVIREKVQLQEAVKKLRELKERIDNCSTLTHRQERNRELMRALELRNLADCLLASATAAAARDESRGVHVRQDRPEVDHETWRFHLVVRAGEEGPLLEKSPVKSTVAPPAPRMSYEEAIVWAAETLLAREEGR